MSSPCSVTKHSHLHVLTSVDAGPDAPPFKLTIRVDRHKRSLSLSTAAAAGSLVISASEYMYDGYWETSCITSSDDIDSATLDIIDSFPVDDMDLYEMYGQRICSDTRDLVKTAGEKNLRVEASICLWIDEIDEELEVEFAEILSSEEAEERRRRERVQVVDTEAVLEERDWMGIDEEKCTVCLEEFAQGERVAKMPCEHCFHKECIVPWLTQESNTCPLCRYVV